VNVVADAGAIRCRIVGAKNIHFWPQAEGGFDRDPFSIEYDLGGTIWGGSRFTAIKGELYFNGRPCLPLQSVGY